MKKIIAALVALAGLFFASHGAFAQCTRIIENGTVQNNAAVVWVAPCVIGQAGPSTGSTGTPPMLNDLGVQGNVGILTGPITGNYDSALLGWSATTPGEFDINLSSVGLPTPTAAFVIAGTKYTIPGPGTGNVVGPISPYPTAGHAAIWNGQVNLADAGFAPALKPSSAPTSGDTVCWGTSTLTDCGTTPSLTVASNAALQALSLSNIAVGAQALRQAYYASGPSSGAALYQLAGTNCAAPDNGAQVQPSVGTGCWIGQFGSTPVNPLLWGASGSNKTITCSVSTTTLSCSGGVSDFVVGESIAIQGAGVLSTAAAPTLAVAANNGSGTTAYYTVAPIDNSMGVGAAVGTQSVSGGPMLGTAHDLNTNYIGAVTTIFGNTHGNTTVDNLTLGSGGPACTYTTCAFGVGGLIPVTSNFAANTTISAINSPTSITLNKNALTTASAVGVNPMPPPGGVYNQATITGTANSYAVYEGSSSGSMTCVDIHTNLTAINGGLWNDFGSTHYNACPSWVPNTPPVSALGDVLRTTITAINGNTITIANAATQNLGSTTVWHDDTNAINNAVAFNGTLSFACGTYNVFASITENLPNTVLGSGCATIAGFGSNFDDWIEAAGSANGVLANLLFNDANKSYGFAVFGNGAGSHVLFEGLSFANLCNGVKLYGMNNPRLADFGGSQVHCDVDLYGYADTNHLVAPTFNNIIFGQSTHSANAYGIILDGQADSTHMANVSLQDFPRGAILLRNAVSAARGPHFFNSYDLQINVESGPPIVISAGIGAFEFHHLWLQGEPGDNANCIAINSGVTGGVVHIDGASEIMQCDKNGVINNSSGAPLYIADGSTQIYNNNESQGSYDKVRVTGGSGPSNINLATGDQFFNLSYGTTTENCGVNFVSGYGTGVQLTVGSPFAIVTSAAPGIQAPVCDSSGIYGLVMTDGQFNSPSWATNPSGGTLTTGELLRNQNGSVPITYISGNVSGTPVTWTTPTASALVTAVVNPFVNQQFYFHIVNAGASTVTVAGGSGVTVNGTATTAAGVFHLFRCQITNVGSPAITCTG